MSNTPPATLEAALARIQVLENQLHNIRGVNDNLTNEHRDLQNTNATLLNQMTDVMQRLRLSRTAIGLSLIQATSNEQMDFNALHNNWENINRAITMLCNIVNIRDESPPTSPPPQSPPNVPPE
jgi:hypothetical protein